MAKNNKSSNKKQSFGLLNSYKEVLENEIKSGENIYYARECLLPILDIKILVKERSREELSDTDLILFKLIKQGINTVESISLLTGLAEKLVNKHLNDMLGRSFISFNGETIALTELGAETLQEGIPLRKVQRSFRYCAVSEKLLPRSAYDLVFTELDNLRANDSKQVKFRHVLTEKQLVNLAGLNLSGIEDKREYNITDEAISFDEILGYTSGYLQAKLFLVGKSTPARAIVSFGKQKCEYNLQQILSMLVPLNQRNVSSKLNEEHQNKGVIVDSVEWDNLGLPVINVKEAPDSWLDKNLESGIQAILLCGTDEHTAKPVSLPKLQGYTCRYQLMSPSQREEANLLQDFAALCDSYFQIPFKQRTHKNIREFIKSKHSDQELNVINQMVTKHNIKRLANCIPSMTEEVE